MCLFLLLVMIPHRVNLNRGNHECDRLNAKYGFQAEATKKVDFHWFELVQEAFRFLPLCHVLNESVMVVHGGLFAEEVDLDRLRKLDRTKDLPRSRDVDNEEKSLIMSMLWSDPRDLDEGMRSKKSTRGCGVHFGEQVTKEFLEKSKLSLIVRSHEVCNEGMRRQHDGKLITLFSASHYSGSNTNWGAFLTFTRKVNENGEIEGNELVSSSTTYTSEGKGVFSYLPKKPGESAVPVTAHLMKREALGHLKQIIYQKRHTLLKWFTAADSDHNNSLPVDIFIEGLQTSLNLLDFPWEELIPYIATVENGNIDYIRFLRRYQIKMSAGFKGNWMEKVTLKICREISLKEGSLAESFKKMDKNGDGVLDYVELADCFASSGIGLTDDQLFDIIRNLDENADGKVDYQEFINALGTSHDKAVAETEKVWDVNRELDRLREDVADRKMNLRELFLSRFKDEEIEATEFKKLRISKKSFKKILKKIDIKKRLDKEQIDAVAHRAFKKREKMSFSRFSTVFTIRTKSPFWQEELIQSVCSLLLSTRMHLRSLFTMLDEDNSGNLDLEEFKQSMAMVNEQLGFPLSDIQVANLHSAIDVDGDGFVRFEEFLDALQVVDIEEENDK
uniref:Serine/threonine-protein phosphatase n=1 Tax=Paramoeba aestuarina TaxID=180227 RepID=A0A7S4N3G8_9EUKA